MFNFFKKEKIRPNSVLEFQGHPDSKQLVEYMKKGNWVELEKGLDRLSNDDLYPVLRGLSEFATDWEEVPDIPKVGRLALLKCYVQIIEAWLARSGKKAVDVSDEQFELFEHKLNELDDLIEKYIRLNKSCPLVFMPKFKMCMGLGYSSNELYQVFIAYNRDTGSHLSSHISMAYALTEQWGGSHTELFSFCRTSQKLDARFSPLVAYAHFMRWFYNQHWEDESEDKTYFLQASVQEEIEEAFNQYVELQVPVFEKQIGMNYFAFCFSKGSSNYYLRESLKYVHRSVLPDTWSNDYADIVDGVNVMRQYCQLPKI